MHGKEFEWLPFILGLSMAGLALVLALKLGTLTGWSRLAALYPLAHPFEGPLQHYRSLKIGFASYKSCVTLGVSHEHFYVAIWPIFASGHPPLLIPWRDLRMELRPGFLTDRVQVHFEKVPDVNFYLLRRHVLKLQELGMDCDVTLLKEFKA